MALSYKSEGTLFNYHDIRLNIEQLATGTSIPAEVLEELKTTAQLDDYLDAITNTLYRRLVISLPTSGSKTIKLPYPDSLWQFIKQKYAPNWFKKRYPVKHNYVTLEAKEVFPEYSTLVKSGMRYLDIRIYD